MFPKIDMYQMNDIDSVQCLEDIRVKVTEVVENHKISMRTVMYHLMKHQKV